MANTAYDVLIVGGGPAGLSASLALGRGRKRVLLCDSGPRRNAAAVRVQNFVTRDGTPPDEFRAIARKELEAYATVRVSDTRVASVAGVRGDFRVQLTNEAVTARRILLTTGVVDEPMPIDGFPELWGHSIFQCPYCHGFEVRDTRWGFLAHGPEMLLFAAKLRGWTADVVLFTHGAFEIPEDTRAALVAAGVRIETSPIRRLVGQGHELRGVELVTGEVVARDVLFAHPRQHQVELVRAIGVALDEHGFVKVDPMTCETSVPGVYAAGDLTTRQQGAIIAAAHATRAAAALNFELTVELATTSALPSMPRQ